MGLLLKGGSVYRDKRIFLSDILVENGLISRIEQHIAPEGHDVVNLSGKLAVPGFVDVHVHFREPGFSYKETIASGTCAAAGAGYTAVCTMPNLRPVPDSPENLSIQLALIKKDARIKVYPYAAITKGEKGEELSPLEELAECAFAFSDDGVGVQKDEMMRLAMKRAQKLNKVIAAHAEDNTLTKGGYIHDGAYAAAHGHKGIPSESEWAQVKRDLILAEETGAKYHVCHVSTKESVFLIREAKKRGVDVTCETAPHYLLLSEEDMQDEGRFKMNPPIRAKEDREALLAGLTDGTIDMIATDHAPHSAEEKRGGLKGSLNGIVGLETAFPVLYTYLVKKGIISLEMLLERMCLAPRVRFSLPPAMEIGAPADIAALDLSASYTIDSSKFRSLGRSTPFEGWQVQGQNLLTLADGKVAFRSENI